MTEIDKNHTFMFRWDKIPGEDNGRLIEFLRKKCGIDWVKNAEIKKTDDKKTINVSARKFLSMELSDEKTEVIMKIDGVRKDEFIAKTENGELNIYSLHDFKITLPDPQHDLTKDEYEEILQIIRDERSLMYEQKIFLKFRWLKAVLHLENESEKNKNRHNISSIMVLIASAIIASLAGVNLADTAKLFPIKLTIETFLGQITILRFGNESILSWTLFILGLTVTIIVGLMNLFKFEEVRWKKRIYAEKLKKEGFEFLQLIGKYSKFRTDGKFRPDDAAPYCAAYCKAYPQFAENVEELINEVNEGYTNLFGGGWKKDEGQELMKSIAQLRSETEQQIEQLKGSLIKPDQKVEDKED